MLKDNNSVSSRYGLRKLSVGVASVLLGTVVLAGGVNAHADSTAPESAGVSSTAPESASASATAGSATLSAASTSSSAVSSASNSASNAVSGSSSVASSANSDTTTNSASNSASSSAVAGSSASSESAATPTAVVPAPTADEVTFSPSARANIQGIVWADPAKVNQDATKPGNYTEQIIITWKDGTTTTANWNLYVQGKVTAVVPVPSVSQVTNDASAAAAIKNVAWTNPAKVNQDATKPGIHTEQVTIFWKDGTTTTVNWNLDVRATDHNNGGNNTGSDSNSNSNSNATNNNGSSANNGNSAANGNNNGSVNNKPAGTTTIVNNGNGSVSVINGSLANANKVTTSQQQATLPQTGNENTGAIVALGALAGMFGLGFAAKKREN